MIKSNAIFRNVGAIDLDRIAALNIGMCNQKLKELPIYLTFRRSPYFALAYAANDLVLIWLWILAAITDISYLSVIVCFILFFANDLYGFYSWKRMQKQQNQSASEKH